MSYTNQAKIRAFKTLDTAEIAEMGQYKLNESGELAHVRAHLLINGRTSLVGGERMRLRVHTTTDFTRIYQASDWVSMSSVVSAVPGITKDAVLGWVRFDFDRANLNKNFFYYITAEVDTYTRVADTMYLALAYDFPFPTNSVGLPDPPTFADHALGAQIFVFKPRT